MFKISARRCKNEVELGRNYYFFLTFFWILSFFFVAPQRPAHGNCAISGGNSTYGQTEFAVGWLVVPFKSGTAASQSGESLNLRFKGRLWEKLRLIRGRG